MARRHRREEAGGHASPRRRRGPRPRPSQRAIGRQAARTGNGCGRRFSGAAQRAAFHRETKSPAFAILRRGFGPSLRFGCRSAPPAAFVAMKAAMGAADPTRESRYDHRPSTTISSPATAHPRPTESSTSSSSMATGLSATNPIRGRCRRRRRSPAPSPTSSTRSSPH